MAKSVQQLLDATRAQREAARAKNLSAAAPAAAASASSEPTDPSAPAPAADADPAEPEPVEPAAESAGLAFAVKDGAVFVPVDKVQDGKVTLDVSAEGQIEGLKIEAPAPSEGIVELATKVGELTLAKAKAEAEISGLEISVASMLPIITASLDKMTIALGGSAVDVSALEPAQVVALHESTAQRYAAKFPTGPVAAVAQGHESAQADANANAERDAFLRRTRFTPASRQS